MAHSRVSPDEHDVAGERAFAVQLAATIFDENDFHS